MRSASSIAPSTAPPFSVTRETSPYSAPFSAVIGSAVSAISIATAYGTRLGNRSNAPPAARSPTPTSGIPSFTPSAATMRSQVNATSRPPAKAKPSTAAMSGFFAPFSRNSLNPTGGPSVRNALRSIPAQNPRPVPVSTPAVSSGFSSSSRTAATRPCARSVLTAFI